MIRSLNKILGYKISALDDEIGVVKDFYFNDQEWIIRYVVVDTGKWLPGRKVLIPPMEFGEPRWSDQKFDVSLSKSQIQTSPKIESDLPVSRQQESDLMKYFGWVPYWEPLGAPGSAQQLRRLEGDQTGAWPEAKMDATEQQEWDPQLRSLKEVCGYHILSSDNQRMGSVEEFIVETERWVIRYIIVNTGRWWPGKKVLVSPQWIQGVDLGEKEVIIDLPGVQIKNCPEFNPSKPVNREYEIQLYDYYGRPAYWE